MHQFTITNTTSQPVKAEWQSDLLQPPPLLSSAAPEDRAYYESYSHFLIHEEMLRDSVRTLAYKEAISQDYFLKKTVLDVGCGTGILSVFCAQAGCAKVIAVDNAAIAKEAEVITKPYPAITVI